jgi:hypothetical protein
MEAASKAVRERHGLRVMLVVPRGEAVRNFLSSETLPALAKDADVAVLSVVDDHALPHSVRRYAREVIPLTYYPPARWVSRLRTLTENAHDRWLWSEVAKNNWELRDRRAARAWKRLQRIAVKVSARMLGRPSLLRTLTRLERRLSVRTADTAELRALLERLRPDVVFNCSHIHGIAGELPLKLASEMGITTAGFIFSWDNLTSRSRIFVPYDHWLVWHEGMKRQLLGIYPEILPERVHVTGTPQFDFHFRPEYVLDRNELARRIGFDPTRPFILYTTGIDAHFPEEHRTVEYLIRGLGSMPGESRPQLIVRTYVKGTSAEMQALALRGDEDVYFPEVAWDGRSFMPAEEDLATYTSLLHHCALGINAASTVSLELMIHDKPVINLAFDPPGSNLPHPYRWVRHVEFDHYRPVAESGAVSVARYVDELIPLVLAALEAPQAASQYRARFIERFFGTVADGKAGERVANVLLAQARLD